MCLIAWNWQPESATPLLLLANRDEFYARPAQALQWWDGGCILAGKDLQAGGTWMGLTRTGRLAALTNYRDFSSASNPHALRGDAPSRGELVTAFLNSDMPALAFLQRLAGRAARYSPFNLLVFDGTHLLGLQSRGAQIVEMQPGIGAVSNADFHSPWPKLTWLSDQLENHVNGGTSTSAGCNGAHDGTLEDAAGEADDQAGDPANDQANDQAGDEAGYGANVETLLSLLKNEAIAPDEALPQTGLPLARERALSAAFITSPEYGTRACSVVRIARTHAHFVERSFDSNGLLATQEYAFSLSPAGAAAKVSATPDAIAGSMAGVVAGSVAESTAVSMANSRASSNGDHDNIR